LYPALASSHQDSSPTESPTRSSSAHQLDCRGENIAPDHDNLADLIHSSERHPAGISCYTWLPRWLPIAANHAGSDLFIGLRHDPDHGGVMLFYEEDGLALTLWPNLTGMASAIADGLDDHTLVGDSHLSFSPHVENGHLTWRRAA
jgi:cell wall assembly regulator SMI1